MPRLAAEDAAYFAGRRGVIYLLHFDRPVGTGRGPVQHYLGWARCLGARLHRHQKGWRGAAALTRSAKRQGIGFRLVAVWPGTRDDERAMKRRCERWRLCPDPGCVARKHAYDKADWQRRKARRAQTTLLLEA